MMETALSAAEDAGVEPNVVFDVGSGISEEEQRGILEGIETAVRRDRRTLAEEKPVRAKKRALFPLWVNLAALLILGAALALFMGFRGEDGAELRRGGALYNSTERALIREIRLETTRELEAKEAEIGDFLAKLAGVNEELRELYSNNQELTAEQKAVEANLRLLQEEYTDSLSSLQDERSRILESSRAREANLKAQLDERAAELAAQAERSREALSSAQREIERLAGDQEKGAAIEAQLSGLYTRAAAAINEGNVREAAATLNAMRDFINTPSFQGIHSVQPRKAFYFSSINTLEGLTALADRLNTAVAAAGGAGYEKALAELEEQNAALEEQAAALGEAAASEGSSLGRQVNELQSRIGVLQAQSAQQDRTLEDQRRRNTELDRQIAGLRQAVEEQQRSNTELSARAAGLDQRLAEANQSGAALRQTVAERDAEISGLRTQNAEKDASIQALNSQLAAIRQLLQNSPEQ
ncbi:MAG: hypothetical protein LBH51_07445 [Treponema sp.]|jgi:chromosome segregation ATPase|nr:hypothetical protein [Treponema sp.]